MSGDSVGLEEAISHCWPTTHWHSTHVVVGVSGGADSVALLVALRHLQRGGPGRLIGAHFHHGLRGIEADEDEAFVRSVCEKIGVSFVVGRAEVAELAAQQGDGVEAAARQARYQFLLETAQQSGARFVATAHTADDQVETVLHRILRGTGVAGLSGMRLTRELGPSVTLVRPLLHTGRKAVELYLSEREISYREDATNRDLGFARNRIRHDLLPKLRKQYNANVDEALLRLASLARECEAVVETVVADLAADCLRVDKEGITIDCTKVADQSPYVIRALLMHAWRIANFPQQAMGWDKWMELAEMATLDESPPSRDFPGDIRATKSGEQLSLTRR